MDIFHFLGIAIEHKQGLRLLHLWGRRFIPSVIDQREIQELCAECREHPFPCFMKLLAEILDIEDASVLDLTFGIGEFYMFWKPKYLAAFDIVDWRKHGFKFVCEPDEFYEQPFEKAPTVLGDRKFDVVVFDPPYSTNPSSKSPAHEKPWLYHNRENLDAMLRIFPKIAKKYARKYVIVKIMGKCKYALIRNMHEDPTYEIVFRRVRYSVPAANVKILDVATYVLIWKLT